MKKIIIFFLVLLFGISFNTSAGEYQLSQADSASFYVQHFYWNLREPTTDMIGANGSKNLMEYMGATFWFSFVIGLIIVCIDCGIALSESSLRRRDREVKTLYKILNRLFIIGFHIIFWILLLCLGMFLANFGSGWFVGGGLVSAISLVFLLAWLNGKIFVPFSQTICIFWDTKKKYIDRYNDIKGQEILNHL